jgi:hypothetical protein
LRTAVLKEGQNPLYLESACTGATRVFREILAPVTSKLEDGVELTVHFKK